MADELDPVTLLPTDDFDEDLDVDDLEALEDDLDEPDADVLGIEDDDLDDLTVVDEDPEPLGRSWLFDFREQKFIAQPMKGPLESRGLATLRTWIEKCLATDRGAHPIHPPDYGVEGLTDVIGEGMTDDAGAGIEEAIRDALLFHPRITDVHGFQKTLGTDEDESLYVSFTVVTDADDELPFVNFPLIAGAL